MRVIVIGNFYYYGYIITMIGIVIGLCFVLENKSKKFNHIIILGLLFSSFLLHFLKLFFEPYASRYPDSLMQVSFENICAVSTMIFPWIYLSKQKLLKDYMVIIGTLSFIIAIFMPNGLVGVSIFDFDVLRYYYAHMVIVLAPLLMVLSGNHQLSYRRIPKIPFVFYGVLILILFNEIILISVGLLDYDIEMLLDPNLRNVAILWGLPDAFLQFDWVVPKIFRLVPFGPNAGKRLYWPVIWLVVPAYFVINLFGFIECFIINNLIKKHHRQ